MGLWLCTSKSCYEAYEGLVTYGNVLSLAAIGVENGNKATGVINTHVGGFECRGHGAPDCVTMYGRTFHYLTMARDLASGIGKYYLVY